VASAALVIFLALTLTSSLGDGLGVLLVLVDGPVEDVVVLEALTNEEVAEDLAKIGVVGLVVEAERTGVVQVDGELVGEAATEDLSGGGHLLLHNAVVLLFLSSRLKTLPGKRAAAEVEHNVSEGLHVITAGLLCCKLAHTTCVGDRVTRTDTQVGVDGSVTSGTSQVLVLSVRDVEMGLGITVLLGETEIDNVDLVATLADAHEEVVRLDITVDEGLGMDVLDAGDELIGEQEDGLQRELAVAEVEEIFQRGTEQIEDHGVVVALGAEPAHEGDTDTASKGLVDTGLILKLRVLSLDALKLDSNLLARDDVSAYGRLAG
jgi:hypothetical protein